MAQGSLAATLALMVALGPACPQTRMNDPEWARRFDLKQRELRLHPPKLLFLGDSLMHELEMRATDPRRNLHAVWTSYYGDRDAVNLGFAGDTTANLLWRLKHGELEAMHPRVAIVLIGGNNLPAVRNWSAAQTVAGIFAVVAEIQRKLPETRILLLSIPPNGYLEFEQKRRDINERLAERDWRGGGVTYAQIDGALESGGRLDPSLFLETFDNPPGLPLHLDAEGWRKVAQAIEPALSEMLGDDNKPAVSH